MAEKNSVLLCIDMQNDFVKHDGALPVTGAEEDAKRINKFIKDKTDELNLIVLTLDSHHPQHISHPIWWVDSKGNNPEPFTEVTFSDITGERWKCPFVDKEITKSYFENTYKKPQSIWPYHCLIGSEGWAVHSDVMDAVVEWSKKKGVMYNVIQKGMCPITEQYSIFKAALSVPGDSATYLNYRLLTALSVYDTIYICGEAMNYCVRASIKTLIDEAPDLLQKVVILKDCMSAIGDFDIEEDEVYKQAVALGARIEAAFLTNFNLNGLF